MHPLREQTRLRPTLPPQSDTTSNAGANTLAAPGAANPPANAPRANAAQNVPEKGPSFITVNNDDRLSTNVDGLDVYNGQNENIGKIQDVVFDKDGKITGYILSIKGFLRDGNTLRGGQSRLGIDHL